MHMPVLSTINLHTKFEVCTSVQYDGGPKFNKWSN